MALHPRINPDPLESIAQTAHMALMTARKTQTRRSGTSYWGMSDGTGIILGDDARDGVNRYEPDTGVQLPLVDTSGIEAAISRADSQITQITNSQSFADNTVKKIQDTVSGMQATLTSTAASATSALTAVAKVQADLKGFETAVSQTYLTKDDAAKTYTTSSQVQQTAKQISAQVVSDYKGADGSGLATQSSLAATKKDILAQVSQTYTTKDGVTQQLNSEIQQTATSLTTTFTNQINKTNGNVQKLSSYIHEDANGITLGRQGTSTPTVHLDTGGVMGLATPNGKFAISFEQKSKGTFRGGTDTYHDAIVGGIGAVYGTESMDQGIGIRFGRYFDSNNRLNSAFTVRQNGVDLFEVDRVYKGPDLKSGVSSSGITTNTQIIALNGIDPKFGVTLNGDRIDPRPLDLHEVFPAMSTGVTLDPSSWAFQIGHLVIAQISFILSKQIYDNFNFVRLAFVNRLYFPDQYTAVGGTSGECAGGLHVLTKPASGMQPYLAYFRRSDNKRDIPYVYGNFMFKTSIASY